MSFPVALQLCTVKNELDKDFLATLKAVKAMGYDGVELSGLSGHSADEVKNMLDEAQLIPVSAHVPFEDLVRDTDRIVSEYADMGCKYIVIPYLLPKYQPPSEKFYEVVEKSRFIGRVCNQYGVQLLYHNNDFEFRVFAGYYALDILFSEVSSFLLKTQLDTCWIKLSGEDPAEYIEKYTNRAPVVTLKDFISDEGANSMLELISLQQKAAPDYEVFSFMPLGQGKQDFVSILEACKNANTEWLVVEQEVPTRGKSTLECARESIDYLSTINK